MTTKLPTAPASAGTHDVPATYDIPATIKIDTTRVAEAFDRMAESLRKIASLTRGIRARYNDPAVVAGFEGRYYARAALDPAYADRLSLDCLVRVILAGEGDPELALLTPENRRRVAVAAMLGWATHRRESAA